MNRWKEHFKKLLNEGQQEEQAMEAAEADRENLSDRDMETCKHWRYKNTNKANETQ